MSKKLWVAALLPWAAFAQNSFATSADQATEITIYSKVKQPLTSALAPIEVITKADIERRQPRSLVDLLETLPGMQFGTQSGGIGQSSSLFVRGTNSNHVLVLLNGRPMAQMVNANVDFSQLPVSNVQRIEYIRGPRAAIYGSRAIGGVVNIITTSQVNDAQLSVTTGSNDYYAADVSINQWVTDDTRLQLGTGYRETRGYDVEPNNGQPDRDGFGSKNLTLGIEHKLNQAWTWDANFNGWENNLEYDYGKPFSLGEPDGSNENNVKYYQLDSGVQYQAEKLVGQLNGSYGEYESTDWNNEAGQDNATNTTTATTRLDGLVQYGYSEQGYVLAGIDWQRDRLLSKSISAAQDIDYSTFPFTYKKTDMVRYDAPDRDNTGVFASAFHTWAPVSFELTGRVDDNEQFGTHGTWQTALSLAIAEYHKVTLSYGTAFKAPSFGELYYPGYSNPELEPEKSQNWELGFVGDYEFLNWQLNLYRNEISNLITSQGRNLLGNTDAVIQGVELVAKVKTGQINHTASFDYTDAADENKNGRQLDRRAKRKFSWVADMDVAKANIFAQVLYVGERNDKDFPAYGLAAIDVVMPSYTIWNLGARYPLTEQLTLNGKINNLFDKDYQVAYGYDAPDMEFYVGADYSF